MNTEQIAAAAVKARLRVFLGTLSEDDRGLLLSERPERAKAPADVASYRATTDPLERRRIQAEVVEAYRPRVANLVRCLFRRNPEHWREAEQVGLIGLLTALEKYDPDLLTGEDQGNRFWYLAYYYVKNEIRAWRDVGVNWAKDHRHGACNENITRQTRVSYDDSLYETEPSKEPTVEEQVVESEVKARLRAFAATLSAIDREILFSENSQRVRSRRYLSLVERATAFVRGPDEYTGGSSGDPVS